MRMKDIEVGREYALVWLFAHGKPLRCDRVIVTATNVEAGGSRMVGIAAPDGKKLRGFCEIAFPRNIISRWEEWQEPQR